MNHKLAVAMSAKKMSGKKSKDTMNLDHLKEMCMGGSYADGGQVREPDPEKAQKMQQGFGYDKPIGNDTVDDKIKNWVASKIAMKSNGGMIDEDDNYQAAPDWDLNEDFLTADQDNKDDDEPMKKKGIMKSILAKIVAGHME